MNYKLKGSKTGKIKSIRKKELIAEVASFVGVICITAAIFPSMAKGLLNVSKSDDIMETISNVENDNYAEEINRLLGLNLDNNYVENVDELCSYMKLIDTYYEGDPIEKYTAKTKLAKDYKKIQDISLDLLKKKIADEDSLKAENLTVYMGRGGEFVLNGDTKIPLKGENLKFARNIADFQCYNPEVMIDNNDASVFDKYITDLQEVIVGSVKLIDNEKDSGLSAYNARNVRQ